MKMTFSIPILYMDSAPSKSLPYCVLFRFYIFTHQGNDASVAPSLLHDEDVKTYGFN